MTDGGQGTPDLLEDLQAFLSELCTTDGFCNNLKPEDLFQSQDTLRSAEFADAVLLAEGMVPDHEMEWKRHICRKFTDRYGDVLSLKSF